MTHLSHEQQNFVHHQIRNWMCGRYEIFKARSAPWSAFPMSTMKFVVSFACLAAVAGCAGLGAADCGPDWHAVGQRDGRLGAQPQAEAYARRCGVEVDTANYLRGWQEGFGMRPRPTV